MDVVAESLPAISAPAVPNQASQDQTAAAAEMSAALCYIEEYYYQQTNLARLRCAKKHIEEARSLDPYAKVVVRPGSHEFIPGVYTLTDLSGELLYVEALLFSKTPARKGELWAAVRRIKAALACCPYHLGYWAKLIELLARLLAPRM
jgi:hypothetical protein